MNKPLLGLTLAAVLIGFCARESQALRSGWIITKATQKEHGLNYELTAEKVDDIVLVSMEIPREGKLKDLVAVELQFSGERRTPLSAPLAITEQKGAATIRFQVGTEFVPNTSIMLFPRMQGRSGVFYSIELKDYVTERKPR